MRSLTTSKTNNKKNKKTKKFQYVVILSPKVNQYSVPRWVKNNYTPPATFTDVKRVISSQVMLMKFTRNCGYSSGSVTTSITAEPLTIFEGLR